MSDRVFKLLLSMLTVAWTVHLFQSAGWFTGLVFTITMGALVVHHIEIASHEALKVILLLAWALGIVFAIIFGAVGAANAA